MHPRAAHLIHLLELLPHPEGGHFGEVYRSADAVDPTDGRGERTALTTIYFLLVAGQVSRWHRVRSDEAWHHYEGDPLELVLADDGFDQLARRVLGRVDEHMRPVHVVRANGWQAARTTGAYTLVGCSVAPGFDYRDFELLDPDSALAHGIRERHPEAAPFI